MADTRTEKKICKACGAQIRGGSSFCYSCGESIVSEPPPPAIIKPDTGLLNGGDKRNAKTLAFKTREPAPIGIPEGRLDEPTPDFHARETEPNPTPVRRPNRTRVKKVAEVEWVERSSPAIGFVVASLVLALLVGFLIVAAMYLR